MKKKSDIERDCCGVAADPFTCAMNKKLEKSGFFFFFFLKE